MRLIHESQVTAGDSICATLTYDDEHLPLGGSLRRADFVGFMRRLRKSLARKYLGLRVRFFAIGEYGGDFGRPHYHVILFGYFPRDARYRAKSRGGNDEFCSEELSELWRHGFVSFQRFDAKAANYVTGYITDKPHAIARGRRGDNLSVIFDSCTGEILGRREPEFMVQSRRPGIGAAWLERFGYQVKREDFVMGAPGVKGRVPAYYDRKLAEVDEAEVAERKALRVLRAFQPVAISERSEDRLAVREVVAKAQRDQRKRHG